MEAVEAMGVGRDELYDRESMSARHAVVAQVKVEGEGA